MTPSDPQTSDVSFGDLPPLAGGWTLETIVPGGERLRFWRPASPDDLLDDPCVQAANLCDDYMPYWAYAWPAAITMARAVSGCRWHSSAEGLEIGAGLGLVGLTLAARGLRMTITDYDETACAAISANVRLNQLAPRADVQRLDWRDPPPQTFDWLFACDVLYEERNHEPVLTLLETALKPAGTAWIGDPGRRMAEAFTERAKSAGWRLTRLDGRLQPAPAWQVGTFQLIQLQRSVTAPERIAQ